MNYRLTNPPKKKTVNLSVPTSGFNYNLVRPIGTAPKFFANKFKYIVNLSLDRQLISGYDW